MSSQIALYVIDLLKLLVNPWTIFLLVTGAIFRSEISGLLRSLTSLAGRVSEMSYKDLRFHLPTREEVVKNLRENVRIEKLETEDTKTGQQLLTLVDALSERLTDSDLAVFKQLFSSSTCLVIERGSRYEGTLYRLREAGAVDTSETPIASVGKRIYVQEWHTTPLGKLLLKSI